LTSVPYISKFEYAHERDRADGVIEARLIPLVAARFKALAAPGRLALLAALHEGERSVSELVAATRRGQPNVSQHLANLSRAGLVSSRRQANRVLYRLADPYLARICDAVCESLAREAERSRRSAARLRPRRGSRRG
jgi:DNA-binding transcriptional ArsR family regulator